MTFNRLREITMAPDAAALLAVVQRHAYLVQGNWAVRSDLILEGRVAQWRDYLVYLFSCDYTIQRRDFSEVVTARRRAA